MKFLRMRPLPKLMLPLLELVVSRSYLELFLCWNLRFGTWNYVVDVELVLEQVEPVSCGHQTMCVQLSWFV
jgi:hypothetical protein